MTTIQPMHPDDPLHVILDALTSQLKLISDHMIYPWEDYSGDDDDPKLTRDGYVGVLAFAHAYIEGELSASDGWRPEVAGA